jgi:hypothetical protein
MNTIVLPHCNSAVFIVIRRCTPEARINRCACRCVDFEKISTVGPLRDVASHPIELHDPFCAGYLYFSSTFLNINGSGDGGRSWDSRFLVDGNLVLEPCYFVGSWCPLCSFLEVEGDV